MPISGQDGRDSISPPDDELRYLAIGEITSPHGVRGDVNVRILTDFPERLLRLKRVYVGEEHEPHAVESARIQGAKALMKLAGFESPEEVRKLAPALIYVPVEEAEPLGEDEYYWYQIIGLQVWTAEGRFLGKITDILPTGSNDVYVVAGSEGEVLVPAIEDVIASIDLEEGRVVVNPLEGML